MKSDYINRTSLTGLILGISISIALSFFGIRYGVGFLVGIVIGQINLRLTINYVDNLLFEGKFAKMSFLIYVLFNYGLMILAFFLSVIYPQWINIYMVALGLIMLKLVIYFKEIVLYKTGGRDK